MNPTLKELCLVWKAVREVYKVYLYPNHGYSRGALCERVSKHLPYAERPGLGLEWTPAFILKCIQVAVDLKMAHWNHDDCARLVLTPLGRSTMWPHFKINENDRGVEPNLSGTNATQVITDEVVPLVITKTITKTVPLKTPPKLAHYDCNGPELECDHDCKLCALSRQNVGRPGAVEVTEVVPLKIPEYTVLGGSLCGFVRRIKPCTDECSTCAFNSANSEQTLRTLLKPYV